MRSHDSSVRQLRQLFEAASDDDIARAAEAIRDGSGSQLVQEIESWERRYRRPTFRTRLLSFAIFVTGVLLFVGFSAPLALTTIHINRGAQGARAADLLVTDLSVMLACPHRPANLWRFINRTYDFDIGAGQATMEVCGRGTYNEAVVSPAADIFTPAWVSDLEERTFNAVNKARATYGNRSLIRHDTLNQAAALHSRFLGESGLFQHSFGTYGENVLQMPIGYVTHTRRGKPVVRARIGTPEEIALRAAELWMGSPIHRSNITNESYRWTGLGVAVANAPDGDGQVILFTQTFASRDPNGVTSPSGYPLIGNRVKSTHR